MIEWPIQLSFVTTAHMIASALVDTGCEKLIKDQLITNKQIIYPINCFPHFP